MIEQQLVCKTKGRMNEGGLAGQEKQGAPLGTTPLPIELSVKARPTALFSLQQSKVKTLNVNKIRAHNL
jgi:hypothetical protein